MSGKYFIKTFGCAMNYSDSERLSAILEKHKLKPADKIERADLVIFNTCGVRQMAEDRVYGQVHNARKNFPNSKILLTGCLSHRPDVQLRLRNKVDLFCKINNTAKLEKWLNNFYSSKDKKVSPQENIAYLSTKPKYSNKFKALVPIMTGCNNFCSYCVVPYARGREISRPTKEILDEIKRLIKQGYKEIVLLGQNVNSYKSVYKNQSVDFSDLLKTINKIPGDFWINFVSSHPKDMTDKLIETVTRTEKVCEYVHLPIQAGSNAILKKMNRKYTRSQYLKLIEKIKKGFQKNKPGKLFAITSDIIVGFPGETKKQFSQSAKVMKKVGYDMVYFGQFSPRPQTVAWTMKDNVSKAEKIRREKELNKILKKTCLENNRKHLNTIQDVLIEKKKGNFYYGKTRTGKNVKISIPNKANEKSPIGKILPVKITKANIWNLEGVLQKKEKIVVILGPTASGKSETAIKLAKEFDGEIISADSRQIYKGMDIGSGKITKKEQRIVPHYMLDIVSPKTEYNVAKFKKKVLKHIDDILSRGKLPIICGGTGFWIKAIVDDVDFPEVKPNKELRKKLKNKDNAKLFSKLKKLDPERAKTVDAKNKVRLIRAIEICQAIGKVPKLKAIKKANGHREFLQIGIKREKDELAERIKLNVEKRFKKGMIKEVERLHQEGTTWKRIQSFGLSYFLVPEFLKGKIKTKDELKEKIYFAEKNYAKKQMTWFKKDARIKWLSDYSNIQKATRKFLK